MKSWTGDVARLVALIVALDSRNAFAAAAPKVAIDPPPGWIADRETRPPDLRESPGIEASDFRAWRAPGDASERLVAACFTTEATTWHPEADAIALERIEATAASTALRVAKVGAMRITKTTRTDVGDGEVIARALTGDGEAKGAIDAETMVTFAQQDETPHLVTCFALCAAPPGVARDGACADALLRARVDAAIIRAPEATLWVRALVYLVHRPRGTFGAAIALGFAGAVLLIATRKRPRRG